MECPKCGYDREAEDTHCSLCGANFTILDEQMAAQEELKKREKSQEESPDQQQAPSQESHPAQAKSPAPVNENLKQCPKCQADNPLEAKDCVQCGIIFKRYEELLAQKEAEEEAKRQEKQLEQRQKEEAMAKEREKLQEQALKEIEKAKAKRGKKSKSAAPEKPATPSKPKSPEASAKTSKMIRNIGVAIGIMIVIGLVAWLAVNYMDNQLRKKEEQARIAQKQEEERKKAEAIRKITIDFYDHQEEIIDRLRAHVDNREFNLFKENLKSYDIPPLQSDLMEIKKYFKEIELFESIKKIPATDYKENYKVYQTLSEMAPDKKLYQKKADYYRNKYANEKYSKAKSYFKKKSPTRSELTEAIEAIKTVIDLRGKNKKYNNVLTKLKKAELLYFEGNDRVKMALRDDGLKRGLRKIHVWMKNVGSVPFYINLDFFALICTNNKKYTYNDFSRGLVRKLEPGEQTEGFLNFNTTCRPKKMVFDHSTAGTIFREFP